MRDSPELPPSEKGTKPLHDERYCGCGRDIGWVKVEGKRRWVNADDGRLHTCEYPPPSEQAVAIWRRSKLEIIQ